MDNSWTISGQSRVIHDQKKRIRIGIGQMAAAGTDALLTTTGLGSCVGVVLYNGKGMAGMIHIMLPEAQTALHGRVNRWKYADTAVDDLVDSLINKGCRPGSLKAKIAGGAHMFSVKDQSPRIRIGERNVSAVKSRLTEHLIPIIAEDTGGQVGRSILFNVETSEMNIKKAGGGELLL
ncbi:chemotaxis protein CheD [Halobacillus kuroshimensis]|uniref:chemotaxis protein CheD n=1 Tax=Halobacillus kuroshimensis TaxID=302481 RepID=UPI000685B300|nr:chemotaxis protein CheD [Halobacillus kuroshimensis]